VKTRTRSPSSPAVHSSFALREALFATTAFAAFRIVWVER
jgi:hypothetical protein